MFSLYLGEICWTSFIPLHKKRKNCQKDSQNGKTCLTGEPFIPKNEKKLIKNSHCRRHRHTGVVVDIHHTKTFRYRSIWQQNFRLENLPLSKPDIVLMNIGLPWWQRNRMYQRAKTEISGNRIYGLHHLGRRSKPFSKLPEAELLPHFKAQQTGIYHQCRGKNLLQEEAWWIPGYCKNIGKPPIQQQKPNGASVPHSENTK